MELTNTEGTVYKFRGSLCADFDYEGIDLTLYVILLVWMICMSLMEIANQM